MAVDPVGKSRAEMEGLGKIPARWQIGGPGQNRRPSCGALGRDSTRFALDGTPSVCYSHIMNTNEILTATRDEILARGNHDSDYSLQTDGGGSLAILSVFEVDGVTFGYARGRNSGALYGFKVTGSSPRSNMLRARYFAARDTGDLAGTLSFPEKGYGGRVNHLVPIMAHLNAGATLP